METLKNKIDFAVIFSVKGANPNGDPLNGNRPRVNYEGMGELSDVCLKRKIRNRLMEKGLAIFVQSDDNRVDEYRSLRNRAEGELKEAMDNEKTFRAEACKKWIDVRAFGQVFAYKAKTGSRVKKQKEEGEQNKGDNTSVSSGMRGPVSIHSAFSVAPVDVTSLQITKSVSGEGDGAKKASDTMGMKHRVDQGIYFFFGSMNPQLAERTLFSDKDAENIKQVLPKLFENDASSSRPEGSMRVSKVIWWEHNCKSGQYSSARVHKTLSVNPDGTYSLDRLEGLRLEEIEGF
ncbi:MAG: type I-C CRISPR-associated protein Cas7/Csd2 [Candidatus Gastranaerophilales bacterium]|nr:type I-C CRISPR-associated protein Cas7/Csd2 [Candidatus Gastranaerophilales bacterium]